MLNVRSDYLVILVATYSRLDLLGVPMLVVFWERANSRSRRWPMPVESWGEYVAYIRASSQEACRQVRQTGHHSAVKDKP